MQTISPISSVIAARGRRGRVSSFPDRRGGFTVVEVFAAMTLAVIGVIGFGTLLLVSRQSNALSWEEAELHHRLRFVSETLRGEPFADLVANFQNGTFIDADTGIDVTVTLLVDETDTSTLATEFNLPRDLDGDGASTSTDVSGSYTLLPVRLTAVRALDGAEIGTHNFFLSQEE